MKRRISWPLILGSCLILLSLCFMLVYHAQLRSGTRNCQAVVKEMQQLLPQRTPGVPGAYADVAMPSLEIDGEDYVALLEIPSHGITLPVASQWDNTSLARSPARFSGSAYDKSLVIGGVDDPAQFGFSDEIEHNAVVTLTDMTGAQFSYTVSRVERAEHADKPWLQKDGFDLTLFCRNTYSMEYIAVRCVLASS